MPSLTSTASVKIRILDVNDHAPSFSDSFYKVSCPEDRRIGSVLITINATDRDATRENSQVFYSILRSDGSDLFGIDERSGRVTLVAALDHEKLTFVMVTVRASDRGYPQSLSSTVALYVTVLDVNDCAPHILPAYDVHVMENQPVQSLVTTITATDPDTGPGGTLVYFISDTQNFACSEQGDITARISFDREKQRLYSFLLYVKDMGEPSLTSSATVHVTILDVNDNDPEFVFPPRTQGHANISISYLETESSEVTKVSARDIDEGNNARLSYLFHPHWLRRDIFFVNTTTGYVYLTESPGPRHIGTTFLIKVVVIDHGASEQRYSTSILRIQVTTIAPVLQVTNKIDFSHIPYSILDRPLPSNGPQSSLWGASNSTLTMVLSLMLIIIIIAILAIMGCLYHKIQARIGRRDNAITATALSSVSRHPLNSSMTRHSATKHWRQRLRGPLVRWRLVTQSANPIMKTSDVPESCCNEYVDSERESIHLIKKSCDQDQSRKEDEYDILHPVGTRGLMNHPRQLDKVPLSSSSYREVSWCDESSAGEERTVTII